MAGWTSPASHQAHNLKIAGSNPAPANQPTNQMNETQTHFNDSQMDAITSESRRLCIIGGPGSRKTTTLLHRIKRLTTSGLVSPQYIALVTFTNNAARDMTERLNALLDVSGREIDEHLKPVKLGYAGTIHGMCLRMLQMHGHHIGYRGGNFAGKDGTGIAVLDDDAAYEILQSVAALLGYKKWSRTKLLEIRDQWGTTAIKERSGDWKQGWTPERTIVATYYTRLIANNATDFTGLVTETSRLLDANITPPWTHFFVDEYQDLSKREADIFGVQIPHKISDSDNTVTVIGDVDQAIYNWRGGDVECLRTFARDNPTITLELNYRSDRAICECANNLIRHNEHRVAKDTVPVSQNIGEVAFNTEYESDSHEIMGVGEQILKLINAGVCSSNDIAVLARSNAIVNDARQYVKALGLPIESNDLAPLAGLDADEFNKLLTAVDMLATPRNDLAVYRWLKHQGPKPDHGNLASSTGEVDAEHIRRQAALTQRRMIDVIQKDFGLLFDTHQPLTVQQAAEMLHHLVLRGTFYDFVEDVVATLPPDATVADLALALRRERFTGQHHEGVMVSTMHGAKGLEWKTVFVIALEQEVIPANRPDVEEERRLLYVACTRAKHLLVLSCANVRRESYGMKMPQLHKPSQFIAEMLS
jgi:DNA helicase-2/ATP-dependent DNA helicase PcrA